MSNVSLYNGDCLEVMPTLPDGCADLILADLPYGTTQCRWDTVIPFEPLWAQYKRLIKRNGAIVLFGSQPFTSALVMSNPKWFRYCWVWDKKLSTGFLDANRKPMKRHEDVCVFYSAQPTYNPQFTTGTTHGGGSNTPRKTAMQLYGKFQDAVRSTDKYYPASIICPEKEPQADKVHPTQKPVALGEYLIRTYTNEGETVLDNAMGSGSFGVSAVNTDRNFIGIELDTEHGYFQVAEKRIEEAQSKARQAEFVA